MNKKKIVLFVSSVLLVCLSVLFFLMGQTGKRAYQLINEKQLIKLQSKAKENRELNFDLTFRGEPLPYDESSNTFFLPMSMETTWEEGAFAAVSDENMLELYFAEDFKSQNKLAYMEQNQSISFFVLNQSEYRESKLKITGVPIMTFSQTEDMTEDGLGIFAYTLYNTADQNDWVTKGYTSSALHGNTSLAYEKKSLRLKLLKKSEEGYEKSNKKLLGMRDDDDWILNSLYADENRVRDKLAIDLWQELGANSNPYQKNFGFQAEYVEIFIGGGYQGLYLLMHPVDRKQVGIDPVSAQLSKNPDNIERIYKKKYTAAWNVADFEGELPDPAMPDFRGGYFLKADTILEDLSEWEMLKNVAECMQKEGADFEASLEQVVDTQNVIENWLFYQAIAGFDNQGKNNYFVTKQEGNGLKGYFIPWDLNISFGAVYTENPYYCTIDTSTVKTIVEWEPGNKLIHADKNLRVENAGEIWKKWRKHQLSEQAFVKRVDALEAYVKKTGAFAREKERFANGNCNDDFETIKSYTLERMQFIDEYLEK